MTVLAIDTAGPRLQLALYRPGHLDTLIEQMPTGQAERILPAAGELLARNGADYGDLTRVAVTTGPGSFTGVRIGLSAARGLGLALGIPVLGIPGLLAVSLRGAPEAPVAVLLDARRGEAYVQRFSAPGMPIDDVALLLPEPAARAHIAADASVLADSAPDIERVAAFAASADPVAWPPDAAYIRGADARPQEKFAVARAEPA